MLSEFDSVRLETLTRRFYYYGNFDVTDKYFKALKAASGNDDFLISYCEGLENIGDVAPFLSAYGMLKSKPDYSDYFTTRIIVVEYFIPYLPTRISLN